MRRLALPAAALCGLALAVVPALAADQTVSTSGNSFAPDEVAVKPNEKVTIHNGGMGYHDLNWADGAPGQPNEAPIDWSTERTFTSSGEYVFYCDVHGSPTSGMRGKVYVNDAGTVPSGGGGGGGTTTSSTSPPPGGTTTTGPPQTQPPGGGTPTGTTPPPSGDDTTAPRITEARRKVTRRGVRIRFELSEDATVKVTVLRRGRRVARRIVEVEAGEVKVRVRRALAEGRYKIRLAAEDAAGNRAKRRFVARVG